MPTVPAPQAPDLDTIFDVETGINPYLESGLHVAGVFNVDPDRGTADATTPRVECKLFLGACTARQKQPAGATPDRRYWLPTRWKCRLRLDVVTDRVDPTQAGVHELYRARVRRIMAQYMTLLNRCLPYHRFEELEEAGTTPSLINEDARTEDISRIEYQGELSVRDTAWPVGT